MLMVQNCDVAHSLKLRVVQNCDVARERVKETLVEDFADVSNTARILVVVLVLNNMHGKIEHATWRCIKISCGNGFRML